MVNKRLSNYLVIPLAIVLFVFTLCACSNNTTFGGPLKDIATSIQQTSDRGYIVAGYTWQNSSVIKPTDAWILKLDPNRSLVWGKLYGGDNREYVNAIQQASDGGYIIAGESKSFGKYWQCWVSKIDVDGTELWVKDYGGEDFEAAYAIQQTSDGGYIVAGVTSSFGPGTLEDGTHIYQTKNNCLILKIDSDGNHEWQKVYGGINGDGANAIKQTSDGGYIVAGFSSSETGNINNYDLWILKLNASGNLIAGDDSTWSKTVGGSFSDMAISVQQTSDGGYVVIGDTSSFGEGNTDICLVKLDSSGNMVWEGMKTYGGPGFERVKSLQQTSDGGFIVAGYTNSFGAGGYDAWILKLDSDGNESCATCWSKTYGGKGYDVFNSIQQTIDGGYAAAGSTDSFGVGQQDYWVLKIDQEGNEEMIGSPILSPLPPWPTNKE